MNHKAYFVAAAIGTLPGLVGLWIALHSDQSPDFMARGWGMIAAFVGMAFGAAMGPAFGYLYRVQKRGY